MTMTLKAINKVTDEPDYPIGFWSWVMLDVGCGTPIGLERHETAKGKFCYVEDENGTCPMHNDGYHVQAEEAEAMAVIAEKAINKFPDREKQLLRFRDFCNASGGFGIH